MNCEVGGVHWVRSTTVGKLRRCKVEAQLVWAGLEIDEGLEVRLSDRPIDGWELVVETGDSEDAIKCFGCWVCNCSVDCKDFLVCLWRMLAMS